MNAADEAIEEIREVRRQISAEFGHDLGKYLAYLREEEKKHPELIERGKELLARRKAERERYAVQETAGLELKDKPKS